MQFLRQDKESALEGAVNSLADIFDQYRFNSDNNLWKSSQLTVATTIKGKAEHAIIFYRKEIKNAINKKGHFHVNSQVDKVVETIQHMYL